MCKSNSKYNFGLTQPNSLGQTSEKKDNILSNCLNFLKFLPTQHKDVSRVTQMMLEDTAKVTSTTVI